MCRGVAASEGRRARLDERNNGVANVDTWLEFSNAVGVEATKRIDLLRAAVMAAVSEFTEEAGHRVELELADPAEAESDLGFHLLAEAVGLLSLLTPEGAVLLAENFIEAEAATLKALTDAYHDKMKSGLQVSAHDARAKAKKVLYDLLHKLHTTNDDAILHATQVIGQRPDTDLAALLAKYPQLRNVDEPQWHETVVWACQKMVILEDWSWMKEQMAAILHAAFDVEMEKQKGKVHFFHEMSHDEDRLVFLLTEVEPNPAVYGHVLTFLQEIGADDGYWADYIHGYHRHFPNSGHDPEEVRNNVHLRFLQLPQEHWQTDPQ
jgi:hypothetical protein